MEFGLNRTGGVRPLRPRRQPINAAATGILYLVGCVAYRPYTCFVFDIQVYFKVFMVALCNRADHYIFAL